jgi:hypothetical protein
MYPSLVLAVIGPISAGLVAVNYWGVDWLKPDGALSSVSGPNEGVYLAVCLLPEVMVVDECKMWKPAGAKACTSLEILLLSE